MCVCVVVVAVHGMVNLLLFLHLLCFTMKVHHWPCKQCGDAQIVLLPVSVDNGAVLDVQFDKFYHQPPDGYDSIMIEQSLL